MEELNVELNQGLSEEKEMGLFKRITGVILSPQETMQYLANKPTIWFPLLLVAFSQLIYSLIRFPLFQELIRHQLELGMIQSGQQVPPESIDMIMKISTYSGLGLMPISSVAGWLITTLVFFLLIKLFKGEGSFKQYASVIGYTYVIILLYLCISMPVSFVTGSIYLDATLTNISNLFAPQLQESYLYGILKGINI